LIAGEDTLSYKSRFQSEEGRIHHSLFLFSMVKTIEPDITSRLDGQDMIQVVIRRI
jgi:hypothetical protein